MRDISEFINKIHQGHTLAVLKEIPSDTISCVITSPPYWNLRAYGTEPVVWGGDKDCQHEWKSERTPRPNASGGKTEWAKQKLRCKGKENMSEWVDYKDRASYSDYCEKCNAWKGELGQEPHFNEYILHLCDIFDEIKRVLREDGTCFVNIGDTFAGSGNGQDWQSIEKEREGKNETMRKAAGVKQKLKLLPDKSLCGLPERFMIEMMDRGWLVRNKIIWYKKNVMPSSAKDRFTVDFEPVYLFTKNKKYWFEQQYEPLSPETVLDINRRKNMSCLTGEKGSKHFDNPDSVYDKQKTNRKRTEFANLEKGRNKRCVWDIMTDPFPEAHFAVFPPALVETPILAGCPEKICQKCGFVAENLYEEKSEEQKAEEKETGLISKPKIVGHTNCDCELPDWKPGIVLDPFSGSGTSCMVADNLGRRWIGIDLQPDYVKMSEKRLEKSGSPLFRGLT